MSDAIDGTREGGIEAPTRHPIDWKNPEFWSQEALDQELERAYDICHGCRRCVSLCQAFPTLFDLVDESETLEVDGVARTDYGKVVEHCYLCDLCYQTKCPYVPPHPWNLDFPHLMLRAKAVAFRKAKPSRARTLLSEPDRMGRMATLPVVVKVANAVNRSEGGRKLVEKVLGVHRDAHHPPFASPRLSKQVAELPEPAPEVREAGPTRGRVAVFGTCFGHYNRPEIAADMVAVYRHNGIETRLVPSSACCGMPKMELGDLEAVAALMEKNIPVLLEMVQSGFDMVTPIPSCTLMFRQELPLLFPDDERVQAVAARTFDPFEYLFHRHREGLLQTDFRSGAGKIAYHAPCHQRVQNIGPKTREILSLLPDTTITMIERCSGHDGSYGVRSDTYAHSVKIARPVVRRIENAKADTFTSDCPLAGDHLQHVRGSSTATGTTPHPISLLRQAYGI